MDSKYYSELKEENFTNKPSYINDYQTVTSLLEVKPGTRLYLGGYSVITVKKIEAYGEVFLTDHCWRVSKEIMQKLIDEQRVKNPSV